VAGGLARRQRALMAMVAAIVDLGGGRPRGERVELLVRDAGDEARRARCSARGRRRAVSTACATATCGCATPGRSS